MLLMIDLPYSGYTLPFSLAIMPVANTIGSPCFLAVPPQEVHPHQGKFSLISPRWAKKNQRQVNTNSCACHHRAFVCVSAIACACCFWRPDRFGCWCTIARTSPWGQRLVHGRPIIILWLSRPRLYPPIYENQQRQRAWSSLFVAVRDNDNDIQGQTASMCLMVGVDNKNEHEFLF